MAPKMLVPIRHAHGPSSYRCEHADCDPSPTFYDEREAADHLRLEHPKEWAQLVGVLVVNPN